MEKNNNFFEGVIRQDKSDTLLCDIPELTNPIVINQKFGKKALSGDVVLIKVKDEKWGFVQKVLKRNENVLTGQIQVSNTTAFIKPWTSGFFKDFYVDRNKIENINDGDVVEFKILDWKKTHKSPKAGFIKKVYNATEEQYLIYRMNLPNKFPDDAIEELKEITISKDEINSRVDLRELNIFSIDPETCTDVDDALSFEKTIFGYRVGIHIADVTHFIKAGSHLDIEAYKRSFTYYFPNFNIPMIPQKLSSDLCSLLEGVDRLCVSVIINFDNDLNIIDNNIVRSVINNKKKFSYEEAELHKTNPDSPYFTTLNHLATLGTKVRKSMFPNELILNKKEVNWELDKNGNPIKMKIKKRVSTMDLIQSWMLVCNKIVTQKIESINKKTPWIFRIHDKIENDALNNLKEELNEMNLKWDETISTTNNIKALLNSENSEMVSNILIKKFKSAKYSPEKKGHATLGVDDYTHFTSPIRRYSDIIIHRILLNTIQERPVFCANLLKDCEWISEQEKKAQKVDSYYTSLLNMKFLKDVKYSFNGKIVQIMDNRAIIKTEFLIEGTLFFKENDINSNKNRFIFNNNEYKIGDDVNINITKIDTEKSKIYLKLNY